MLPIDAHYSQISPKNDKENITYPKSMPSDISLETKKERMLRELQEPLERLEALSILCQGISTASEAGIDVSDKLRTADNDRTILQWWQCGDSEIQEAISQKYNDPEIIKIVKRLEKLYDALGGNENIPDNFNFAAASTDLLRIKQKLCKKINDLER